MFILKTWQKRLLGIVILVGVYDVYGGFSYDFIMKAQADKYWEFSLIWRHYAVLFLGTVAFWLMMDKGIYPFWRRVRLCGILLLLNFLCSHPLYDKFPWDKNLLFAVELYKEMYIPAYSFMITSFFYMAISGIFLSLWKYIVHKDPEEQWSGWAWLIRGIGAFHVGLMLFALPLLPYAATNLGTEEVSEGVLVLSTIQVCVNGAIGGYLMAGYPSWERGVADLDRNDLDV